MALDPYPPSDGEPQDASGDKPGRSSTISQIIKDSIPLLSPGSRALVVICALIAVVASTAGFTGAGASLWWTFAAAECAGLVLVFILERRGDSADRQRRQVDAVLGNWWQLVINDAQPGLTYLTIRAGSDGGTVISGEKRLPSGKWRARWGTHVTATKSADPLALLYYWEGSYVHGDNVSGVGVFEFDADRDNGGGWFVTGRIEAGTIDRLSTIMLRRVSKADERVVERGVGPELESLFRARYAEWAGELNLPGEEAAVSNPPQ